MAAMVVRIVAARHLLQRGFQVSLCLGKEPTREPFTTLRSLAQQNGALMVAGIGELFQNSDVVLDCVFGFSFRIGDGNDCGIRPPYDGIVRELARRSRKGFPILAVDVPSGWDVEKGDILATGYYPSGLCSLSAPKLCSQLYEGFHLLGGGDFFSTLACRRAENSLAA
uniref:YjeF N-terminal domain-containing protein n=1 Tax=Palpitomonas bilix TaxID=652834 RepID=A0A7S3GK66_9EUKA|mmetsp:Transcript_7067/g.18188  ORF Transcript_7067/g.18188 Transcript_7067/m.18188 type:complete len:168 (+) Transcript_7067:262-765(+)